MSHPEKPAETLVPEVVLDGSATWNTQETEPFDPLPKRASHEPMGPGSTLASRYVLQDILGRGGTGVVYLALDELLDRPVALKLLPASHRSGHLRPERTALRLLDLPGVVRLLDEGEVGGQPYLVTELIAGEPFPALPTPTPWSHLRPRVVALLEVVARVHRAGVVHGDLKPGNVLVRPDGDPVLLDFGLAHGPAVGAASVGRGWTPRYASPEQLRGKPRTRAADAFSLGVMVLEASVGVVPRRSLDNPAPPKVPPGLARDLTLLLRGLLARRAEDRLTPEGALELLGRELDAPVHAVLAQLGPVAGADELRPLFHGQVSFHRPAERAAQLLFERSGGRRQAMVAELSRWMRTGLLRVDQEPDAADAIAHPELTGKALFRVEVAHLRALEAGRLLGGEADTAEAALGRLLRQGADAQEAIARETKVLADAWRDRGELGTAMATLDAALAVVEEPRLCAPLLVRRAALALSTESAPELQLGVYQLDRAGLELSDVRTLLMAATALVTADRERAWSLASGLHALADDDLEIWRVAIQVGCAEHRGLDAHERVLERHAAWSRAGHARRRAKWLGWMGRLRYVQGRYAEACAFQLEAAAGKRPYEVLSSLLNAATAALEVSPGGLAQAARILSRAERLAATTGKARERARVVRLARTVAYRRGTAGSPRVDLVRAAEQVSRLEGAYFAFNEAAVAWRAGERSLCAQLAQGASGVFVEAGVTQVADLAQALAGAAGAWVAPAEVGRMLAAVGTGERLPDVDAQILALLAPGTEDARVRARYLLDRLGSIDRARRLDVLSLDEVVARVEGQPHGISTSAP